MRFPFMTSPKWALKFWISIGLSVAASESFLAWWTGKIGIPLLTERTKGLFVPVMKLGLLIHRIVFLNYMSGWICYYLRRDNGWPETREKMIDNPLVNIDVVEWYKAMLFDMNPELASSLKFAGGEKLLKLYRERQERCRFPVLI